MKRSKKLFLIISVVFLAGLILIALDISRKTHFPGSDNSEKENRLSCNPEDSVYTKQKVKPLINSIQEIEEKEN